MQSYSNKIICNMENSNEPIRSMAARMLQVPSFDFKKKMEDHVKESNKLLIEGGYIKKEKKNIWKEDNRHLLRLNTSIVLMGIILCILLRI